MAATWAMTLPRGPGSQDPNRRPPCSFFQSATAQPAWCSHLVCSRAFAGPRCRVARTRCGPSANAATPAYRASTARGRSSSPDGESHLCLWNRTWAYHRSGQEAMRVSDTQQRRGPPHSVARPRQAPALEPFLRVDAAPSSAGGAPPHSFESPEISNRRGGWGRAKVRVGLFQSYRAPIPSHCDRTGSDGSQAAQILHVPRPRHRMKLSHTGRAMGTASRETTTRHSTLASF